MIPVSQSPFAGKIVRRKLADEILERLLSMVEQGEVVAGDCLPSERELMQRFGVGRPAVREAMQALAGMGVIQIQHGERARLNQLGAHIILEQVDRAVRHLLTQLPEMESHLREARLHFETGMVRAAAQRAATPELTQLEEKLELQRAACGNPAEFVAADMAFHNAIAAVSGNPVFVAVSRALLQWLLERYPALLSAPGVEELTLQEHSAILEAIRRHDQDAAAQALIVHLTRSDPRYGVAIRRHTFPETPA